MQHIDGFTSEEEARDVYAMLKEASVSFNGVPVVSFFLVVVV